MKRGNISIVVLIIVAVVLGLSLAFILNNNSTPTGYAGSPVGAAITAFIPSVDGCGSTSCESSSDCTGDFASECCNDGASCNVNGQCNCIEECSEGNSCGPEQLNSPDCGGKHACVTTDPYDGEGAAACDCDDDGCPEDASCSTFNTLSGFANPCGTGHCVITGIGEMLTGKCICNKKACELTEDGDKDQCPKTVKCEEGPPCSQNVPCPSGFTCGQGECRKTCSTSAQCGGPGVGTCVSGFCNCFCKSWAPCQSDEDCGPVGDCVIGSDGAPECMCANAFGCSFDQCEPGVTPCNDGDDDCFGGNCQTTDGQGVCKTCGVNCNIDCSGDGACPETVTQANCNAVGAALGGASCTVGNDCDCNIPDDLCDNCVEVNGVSWCPD